MAGLGINQNRFGSRLPFIFRDSQNAYRNFEVNGNNDFTVSSVPKPKFLFLVKFVTPDRNYNGLEGVTYKIKTIDRPKVNVDTHILDQYNKKRVIQTGVKYQPITITFHDDVSDKVLEFWRDYFGYYYADGRKTDRSTWSQDITNGIIFDRTVAGEPDGYDARFGLTADSDRFNNIADSVHFIQRLDLYTIYGGRYTTISFINPKITNFDHDANDYSDGTEGSGITMMLEYEGIVYNLTPTPIGVSSAGDETILLTERDLNSSTSFYDIPRNTPSAIETFTTGRAGLFGLTRNTRTALREISASQNIDPRSGLEQAADNLNQLARTGNSIADTVSLGQNIVNQATGLFNGSASVIANRGISFGQNVLGLGSRIQNLAQASGNSGGRSSQGLTLRGSRATSGSDSFGVNFQGSGPGDGRGLSLSGINDAANALSNVVSAGTRLTGDGSSRLVLNQNDTFSEVLGTVNALSRVEGLTGPNQRVASRSRNVRDNDGFFNIFPNGTIETTNRGAFAANSARSPSSAIGSSYPRTPDTLNSKIGRALASEVNSLFDGPLA